MADLTTDAAPGGAEQIAPSDGRLLRTKRAAADAATLPKRRLLH